MKTPIRRYQLALLFSLLALFGVSISAQRIWETLPASFKEKMHSTRRATDSSASPGVQSTNTLAEPAQATLAIPQNVLPGGGGTSTGGTLALDGTIGQGLAGGAMSGGSLSASSGFWGAGAANQCPTIAVGNPQNPGGVIGTALSRTFTQTGGVGAITFSLNSGTLPTGVTLAANGTLSGTPMQFGNFPMTVKATDSNNCSGIGATYTLVVSCQSLSVFNPAVTTATVGTPFSQNFTHTGGLGTVTFTTNNSALPPGLALAPNGTLSGTPTQAGSFTFTVSIGDGNNCGVSGLPYTLVVSPGTTTARVIRAVNASGNPGGTVVVPIELASQGDENAISFSLTFDPSVLSNPQTVLGSDANGASQNVNVSQVVSGRLGLIVALPSGQSFSAGVRRIFAVTFTIAANTSANSTSTGFGNQPVAQEVASAAAATLPASFVAGTVAISRGIEADVTPAPDGNGSVTVTDYVKVGRFAAGLDTPASGGEFQRADCAPRASLGNGALTVSDFVQAGRYAAGLDELVPAGGPTAPINLFPELERNLAMVSDGLAAQKTSQPAVTVNLRQDALLTAGVLAIELNSQGTENAMAFSLSFDPKVWQLVAAVNGRDARGATLLVNEAEAAEGRLGFVLALPTGAKLSAGQRQLALVRFARIAGSAKNGQANGAISFTDAPVARELVDVEGSALSADYTISNSSSTEIARTAAVVSAAGIEGKAFASEAIAVIFGKGLATATQLAEVQSLELVGTRVMVRDSEGIERPAPLLFVSPGQINFRLPADTAQGFVSITITGGDGTTSFGTARIEDAASDHAAAKADKWETATAVVLRINSDGAQQYESLSRYDAEEGRIVPIPLKAAAEGEQVFLILFGIETRHAKSSTVIRASIIGSEGEEAAEVMSKAEGKADGDSASPDQVRLRLPQTLKNSGVMEVRLTVNGKTANKVRVFRP